MSDKPIDVPPICALYQGNHPNNYRGCQIHEQLQKNRKFTSTLTPPPSVYLLTQETSPQVMTFSLPRSAKTQSRITYSQTTSCAKPNPSTSPSDDSTNINSDLNAFILEIKALITLLPSLFTTVVTQFIQNNNDK